MATSLNKVFDTLGNEVDSSGQVSTGSGINWSAGVSFKRSSAVPLEKYSIFKDYESASNYASLNSVAYPGQIVVVLQDATDTSAASATAYIIKPDGTLKEVGTSADLSAYATKVYVDDQVKTKQDSLSFTGDSGTNIVTKDTIDGSASEKLESITVGDSQKIVTLTSDGLKVHDVVSNQEYILTLPESEGRLALSSEIVTAGLATHEADGLLAKEDKVKLDSYTTEDVQKWKDGYDKLQTIKTTISAIDFQNTDETVLTDISNAVWSIINAFK